MLRIERAGGRRKVTWWTLLGLFLVPLILAGGLLAAARPNHGAIDAAIVNLDQAVTIEGQIVPLGRQLSAKIVEQADNVSWTLADLPRAKEGLKTGQYSVVIVIPREFSAAATSYAANDAGKAKQATIHIEVGRNSPVTDAAVAQMIARAAADLTNTMLTEAYLDNIYLGFNTMGEQFATITDGARQLADGSKQLDDGLGSAVDGARKLADGMGQFSDGMPKLVDGIDKMSSDGGKLLDGVGQFADGTVGIVGGVDQLGKGLRTFEKSVRDNKPDYSELQKLKAGAAQVAGGASGLSGGLDTVSNMLLLMTRAQLPTPGGTVPTECPVDDPQTCAVFAQVMALLQRLTDGDITIPPELFDQLTCPVDDATQCAIFDQVIGLIKNLANASGGQIPPGIIDQFQCPVGDQETCVLLLRTYLAGFQTGTGVAWAALNVPDPQAGQSLRSGAKQLAGGAKQLSDGVAQFVDELPKQAAAQQKQLADGIGQLAAGAEKISNGAKPLVDNAAVLKSGASQFKQGLRTLASEVQALPGGAAQLASGSRSLADGLAEARSGATKLSEGLDTFATKLAEGAEQVPYYSAEDRAALKKVVTRPIINDSSVIQGPVSAIMALLLAVGLWLGATACYLVLRAVPSRVVTSSRPTWQLTGSALAPGMALAGLQAVVLGAFAGAVTSMSAGSAAALVAVLALVGAAFVAVNHAVAAWFGGWGRLVFLTLAVVAAALGLTSGVPTAIVWLGGLSPVTPAMDAIRSLGTGASITGPVGALLLWLVVGLAGGYLAIWKRRQLKVSQLAAT